MGLFAFVLFELVFTMGPGQLQHEIGSRDEARLDPSHYGTISELGSCFACHSGAI